MAKQSNEGRTLKLSEQDQVDEYMSRLNHPLKSEIEFIRTILKKSDRRIQERIKWNAPSYYHIHDIVTFGPLKRDEGKPKADCSILLVFHHPSVSRIESGLFEGDYKDRRLARFCNMGEIKKAKEELKRIMDEIIADIDSHPKD